jgi:hypothetical protein
MVISFEAKEYSFEGMVEDEFTVNGITVSSLKGGPNKTASTVVSISTNSNVGTASEVYFTPVSRFLEALAN